MICHSVYFNSDYKRRTIREWFNYVNVTVRKMTYFLIHTSVEVVSSRSLSNNSPGCRHKIVFSKIADFEFFELFQKFNSTFNSINETAKQKSCDFLTDCCDEVELTPADA